MPVMPAPDTWSYVSPGTMSGPDPAWADVDEVRFWLQDTNPAVRLFSDLELQWLIDTWVPKYDSLVYVAAVAAETVAAKFAGVSSISADGVNVSVGDLAEHYTELAAQLRQLHDNAKVGGEIDLSNLMWDQWPDYMIKPLEFGIGLDDNVWAGRQDYGTQRGTWVDDRDAIGWY